jgi:N-acetylglucosaminyldiphosphoundecaprenol N-acetyl-beta-D-mannosaminyltransferase
MAGRVEVGPFAVDDLSYDDAVETCVALATAGSDAPSRAYALHVGGLNHRRDPEFVAEMRAAEVVYADGGSVVLLAKLAGAHRTERAPTTDLGWSVLRAVGERLGRPARVGLLGGPPGLVERAGAALVEGGAGKIVFTADGYQSDWAPVLANLRAADPDVVVVGLGAPREMLWVREHLELLPNALILTCGGWFGFLAGEEERAVGVLRRPGLEWIARVAQSPRRLGGRYLRGIGSTAALAAQTIRNRWRR